VPLCGVDKELRGTRIYLNSGVLPADADGVIGLGPRAGGGDGELVGAHGEWGDIRLEIKEGPANATVRPTQQRLTLDRHRGAVGTDQEKVGGVMDPTPGTREADRDRLADPTDTSLLI
jgi:hypothetical protein